ncbi:hypothetical protein PNEG_02410 [Pneumocystis murina B123]|uniref:Nucleoporin Nup159/Nup146 N-terminal domain-containing protein n=1 Tax=Pneumocystis murina (strain B123) TaxID=1069680 RepID=M7NLC5_PNEMU|nr:hypothetical protein PNEG_02410 [Pneumocystis murina B123]EMR09468.1 hypothetical protein PNEG_02410 [Pneumocystis murina B123]
MLNSFSFLNTSISQPSNEIYVELEELDTDNFGFLSLQHNAYIQIEKNFTDQTPRYNASLLCIGNKNGYYAIGIPSGFAFGTTESLRESLKGNIVKKIVEHNPLSIIHLQKKIINVSFCADEKYLIVVTEENEIMFYCTQKLFQKNNSLEPEFIFQVENIKDILPNPINSNMVAVLTFFGNLHLINFSQRSISEPLVNNITSFSWSQKGKQIVCGTSEGKLVQYTPDGSLKAVINKPKSLNDAYYVSSILWLENHVFFVVYNDYKPTEDLKHDYVIFIITREHNGIITYGKLVDPSPPFGLTSRIDHHFIRYLKNWEPNLKSFVIVAATASADVGIVVRNKDDLIWKTLTISNETRRVSLPYSILNDCDTSPIGIALDFTLSQNIEKPLFPSEEPKEGPPLPILYILNNDYLLTGYYVLYVDAIRAGRTYDFICPIKGNTSDICFNQSAVETAKEFGFGFKPMLVPSLPVLNSKPVFENTLNSQTIGSIANNSVSFGVSFGKPAFGVPVFGNPLFGSSENTGVQNIAFGKKFFNNVSQAIKPSSFASFASLIKSDNESPFGKLVQNSSGTSENKMESIFSKSTPLFSFSDSSRFQNEDDIEDALEMKNESILEDKIDCISNKESETHDNSYGEIEKCFNNNEKNTFMNSQPQSLDASSLSSKISSPFISFGKELSFFSDSKVPSLSSLTVQEKTLSGSFFVDQENQIKREIGSSDARVSFSSSSGVFRFKNNDKIETKEKTVTGLFFKDKNENISELHENYQLSSRSADLPVLSDNISHNDVIKDENYEKNEFNQNNKNEIFGHDFDFPKDNNKKKQPSSSDFFPEHLLSLKGNVSKDSFNVSSNESAIYDINKNLQSQDIFRITENLHENNEEKLDTASPPLSSRNRSIDFSNDNLHKNLKDNSEQTAYNHSKSQDFNALLNTSSTLLSNDLNAFEFKNDDEISFDLSQIKTPSKNIVDETHDDTAKRSPLFKNQYMIKLKPLLSMSEALKAQSKEKGLFKEIDIICRQMDNELNIIQENLERLSLFIEDQKENNSVENDSVCIFRRHIEEWKLEEIPRMGKMIFDLLNDISNFQKIEDTNLDIIKSLKKTFIKLEAKHIEVSRFIRARTDHEFTRMIKVRQLGSEHLENQIKLRKICQNVENYLWKAEEGFALYKAKLAGKTNGNIKLPSLESIKKVLGKINSLIQQSMNETNNLEFEFKRLKTDLFLKTKDIKSKTRKNLSFSENMLSIITADMLRKDKFLIILKELMRERNPLHTTIYD